MTATLSAEGHIILPPEANAAAHTHEAEEFHVLISPSGVITLSPKRVRKQTLLEHLTALRGFEFEHRRDPAPDRVVL